MEWTEYLGIF